MSTEESVKLLRVLVGTLGRLLNPAAVEAAVRAAAQEAGVANVDDYIKAIPTAAAAAGAASAKKAGRKTKEPKEKKERKPRAVGAYMIFVTKAMEKIAKDPSYKALTVRPDGTKVGGMAIAGQLWKALSEEEREAFNKAYQPLCDALTVENTASGHKTEGLSARIAAFEAKFDEPTKADVRKALPDKLGAKALPPPTASGEESGSEESSSDSDSEEDEAAKKKAKEEEERKAKEEAKKAKEEAKKKEEKKAKKAKKEEEGATPKADKKHKHKGEDGKSTAKKAKKEE